VSEPASYLDDTPVGPTRKRVVRFVVAFLLLQLVVPLSYYLRSGDPYDERFSWRMFSAVRLYSCRTSAIERVGETDPSRRQGQPPTEREIPLSSTLHQAWVNHLARNRRDVVLAFLEARCEEEGVREVSLTNACTAPDGEPIAPQVYRRVCESGELTLPDEAALSTTTGRRP
jgi:hypothetical protein